MKQNEQTEKTLGQILWESIPFHEPWDKDPHLNSRYEKIASAVEQAVLERLPGEWVLLPDGTPWKKGDEVFSFGMHAWVPMANTVIAHNGLVRRRIRPEAKAEIEWKLPSPPDGQLWHRDDWTKEMLPVGWRPLLSGERAESGDEWGDVAGWSKAIALSGVVTRGAYHHYRTQRPLPESALLPPSELRAMLGGRTAHREDGWRREWLTGGWRPLLKGESGPCMRLTEENGQWEDFEAFPAGGEQCVHMKVHRPLPPTTEQKPEGVSRLASLREAWAARRAFVPASSESPPQGTDVPPSWWSQFSREELETVAEGYGNHIVELDAALSRITKERDEARAINVQTLRDSQEQHARAEQAEKQLLSISQERDAARAAGSETAQKAAQLREENCQLAARLVEEEKKLVEAEREWKQVWQPTAEARGAESVKQFERAEALQKLNSQQSIEIYSLIQKLQQAEASGPRWIPTSTRPPTKEDADKDGYVSVINFNGGLSVAHWRTLSESKHWPFWMTTIPLPTPTEEKDAFSLWEQALGDGACMGDKRELMKQAFLAGQASNSPLTKD